MTMKAETVEANVATTLQSTVRTNAAFNGRSLSRGNPGQQGRTGHEKKLVVGENAVI